MLLSWNVLSAICVEFPSSPSIAILRSAAGIALSPVYTNQLNLDLFLNGVNASTELAKIVLPPASTLPVTATTAILTNRYDGGTL